MTKVTVENEEGKKEYEFMGTFVVVGFGAAAEEIKDGNLYRQVIIHKIGNLATALGMLEMAKRAILDREILK